MSINTRPLWEEIFSEDSDSFLDYYYTFKTRENWVQTDVQDGELVSMIHWNPYPLWVHGKQVDSRYLIAVATKEAYRHQGRMARLLREGLQRYAAEGMPFVWLMPANPEIYYPFDFRYIYDKIEGKWPADVEDAAQGPAGGEHLLTVQVLPRSQYPLAAAFLQRELCARYDIFAERTVRYLTMMETETASEGGHLMEILDNGRLVGVFSYWLGETVEIRELVVEKAYESGAARQALVLALNRCFQATALPITAITTGWLGEPKPIIMARLVSLRTFMPLVTAEEPTELCLRICDPILPENDGVFRWRLGTGLSSRFCGEQSASSWKRAGEGAVPDLTLSIAELTQWLFGEARADYPQIRPLKDTFFNEIV